MSVKIIDFQKLNKALKFNMAVHVVFEKYMDPEVRTDPAVCLVSEQLEVYADTDISKLLDFVKLQLIDQIDTYEQNGSGWVLYELSSLQLTTWVLNPLRGKGTFSLCRCGFKTNVQLLMCEMKIISVSCGVCWPPCMSHGQKGNQKILLLATKSI